MLIILPLGFNEPPPLRPHATPVTWSWVTLLALLFVLERLVAMDLAYGFNVMPPALVSIVTFVIASWSCYADPALFAPWQLWSYVVVTPVWWQAVIDLMLLMLVVRTMERALGSLATLIMALILAAMAATLYLLLGAGSPVVGSRGVLLALTGILLGRQPLTHVRMGFGYWLIITVGWRELGTIPLFTLMVAVVTASVLATTGSMVLPMLGWSLGCVALGVILGLVSKRPRTASG